MVDAGPEPTFEEKIEVPPPPPGPIILERGSGRKKKDVNIESRRHSRS